MVRSRCGRRRLGSGCETVCFEHKVSYVFVSCGAMLESRKAEILCIQAINE